ncbi:MAG: glycosyltransferase [Phycisphaerales bacterium]|jgi:dolichol-phosphate mannosyltransferase|nr:glycosyltransferase [Phycisphaerales bacterium]
MSSPPPPISLIVPTLNEAENLESLVERIAGALAGREYEILIVDDNSRDRTPEIAAQMAKRYPLRLLVRQHPTNGLSGAVMHGMTEAKGEILVVMDADLQHPPEKIPELIQKLERDGADFVIGSRYAAGGSMQQEWGLLRRINSSVATLLARPFAGKVSDPMSGFFALRRSTYERALRLTPLGYKIGLELICKCRVRQVGEVPIHFAVRQRGESKLTVKQQFKYLEHLSRLYDFCFPRLSPIFKFLIVTTTAWFVGWGIYLSMLRLKVGPAAAPSIAYLGSIAVTAVFHLRYVRTQREFILRKRPWVDFWFIALAEWAACSLAAVYAAARLDNPWDVEIFLISFGLATVTRYIMRKEFLQDVRGLRRDMRLEELSPITSTDTPDESKVGG